MSPLYILEREETLAQIIQITQSHFSPHYDIYLIYRHWEARGIFSFVSPLLSPNHLL